MRDWMKAVEGYNVRKARPRRGEAALLVINMQEYFREMAAPAPPGCGLS